MQGWDEDAWDCGSKRSATNRRISVQCHYLFRDPTYWNVFSVSLPYPRASQYHSNDNQKQFVLGFPCDAGTLPPPPPNGNVRLLQSGFKFGPCLGLKSLEHETLPSCPDVSVLVMEDEILSPGDIMKTIIELKIESLGQELTVNLHFSKTIYVEDIEVWAAGKTLLFWSLKSQTDRLHFQHGEDLSLVQGTHLNEIRATITGLGGSQYRVMAVVHLLTDEPWEMCVYDSKCYHTPEEIDQLRWVEEEIDTKYSIGLF